MGDRGEPTFTRNSLAQRGISSVPSFSNENLSDASFLNFSISVPYPNLYASVLQRLHLSATAT